MSVIWVLWGISEAKLSVQTNLKNHSLYKKLFMTNLQLLSAFEKDSVQIRNEYIMFVDDTFHKNFMMLN